jgi:hypothetical protein
MESVAAVLAGDRHPRYESLATDDVLRPFLSIRPKTPIKFADADLPSFPLPEKYTKFIRAISQFCKNPCAAYRGITGFLEDVLRVPDPDSILAVAKNAEQAMYLGLKVLAPEQQREGLERAIRIALDNYEGAWYIPEFDEFMAIPAPEYVKASGSKEFNADIGRKLGNLEPVEEGR